MGAPPSCAARRFGFGWLLVLCTAWLAGCAALPERPARPPTFAPADVGATRLARIAAAATPADRRGLSGFRLLPEGEFAFNARLALARRAERSIDAQYYLIQDDAVGRRFLRELRDAAVRGVRVRLLIDDLYTGGEDDLLAGLAATPNAEVRVFNPLPVRGGSLGRRIILSLHQFGRVNHRMHNKLFVADNSFAVSGGRNIADEYFMKGAQANFIDLDVLSSGPVVHEMSAVFDLYWNSDHVYPIESLVAPADAEALRRRFEARVAGAAPDFVERERDVLGHTPLAAQLDSGRLEQTFAQAEVFADTPAKVAGAAVVTRPEVPTVTDRTIGFFAKARDEVNIVSPYFIPGERGIRMMRSVEANDENQKITLITNSLGATDEPLVHAGYARYRLDMLKAGVRIFELSPTLSQKSGKLGNFGSSFGRLHAKAAVVDRRWTLIGSMNLDARSAFLNTEMGLAIDSPEIAEAGRALAREALASGAYRLRLSADGEHIEWHETTADGQEIVHMQEPGLRWLQTLRLWLYSLFVGDEQL